MNCKFCKREIEDDSIFCRYCGEKVVRASRKPRGEVSVPKPVQLKDGRYRGRFMLNGERIYITESTEAAYYIRAKAVKAGMIAEAAQKPKGQLGDLIDAFIADRAGVLSPSTVYNYRSMRRNRFSPYMGAPAAGVNYQKMISDEAAAVGAKTVWNAWQLVASALRYAGMPVPPVALPRRVQAEVEFLDYEQVEAFVDAVRGHRNEFAFLMGLHSLRFSEIAALGPRAVSGGIIRVCSAKVPGEGGMVVKNLNKTDKSRRNIPILIERLDELLPSVALPIAATDAVLNRQLHKLCEAAGLPAITLHGLRHSFASLAYHLRWAERETMRLGGWSSPEIVHRIYTHLSERDISDDVERMRKFYKGEPLLTAVPDGR